MTLFTAFNTGSCLAIVANNKPAKRSIMIQNGQLITALLVAVDVQVRKVIGITN
jgi:hypothetical protein